MVAFILGALANPSLDVMGNAIISHVAPDSKLERVSLERLCLDESILFAFAGCGSGGTAQVAKGPYTHTSTWVGTAEGRSHNYVLEAKKNSCKRLVLRFALPDGEDDRKYWVTFYPHVNGKQLPAVQAEVSGNRYNSARNLVVDVDRHPFVITAGVANQRNDGGTVGFQPVLLSGYALCEKGLR